MATSNGNDNAPSCAPEFSVTGELEGDRVTLPDAEEITLEEALSWLALGELLDLAELQSRMKEWDRVMADLHSKMRDEDPERRFSTLPGPLHFGDLISTLYSRRAQLGPNGIELLRSAMKYARLDTVLSANIRCAEQALIDLAKRGRLQMRGATDPKQIEYSLIPTEYFRNRIEWNALSGGFDFAGDGFEKAFGEHGDLKIERVLCCVEDLRREFGPLRKFDGEPETGRTPGRPPGRGLDDEDALAEMRRIERDERIKNVNELVRRCIHLAASGASANANEDRLRRKFRDRNGGQ